MRWTRSNMDFAMRWTRLIVDVAIALDSLERGFHIALDSSGLGCRFIIVNLFRWTHRWSLYCDWMWMRWTLLDLDVALSL